MQVTGQLHASADSPQTESRYPLERRLGGPQNRSGHSVEEKIPSPRRKLNPGHRIDQPVVSHYTDWAIPVPHNEELHNVYASPNIIRVIKWRRMRWAGQVALMEEMSNSYKPLVWIPERKTPFGRPSRRWEDNIRMDLTEIGWEVVDCIHLAQDRNQWGDLVNTVMNTGVP
jgi:hypothetical protein